ncbi:LytTR family DNA-binding domain-containing protein [Bacteroidales bacterium OttesenSCG-928-I14]|nr:LytTR family DNA-binding domain-containing protein [Bacteroidales bacterium OttesenSCG-928-I14]
MHTYSYVIVDDDNLIRLQLSTYLQEYPFLKNVATFSSSVDAQAFLLNNKVDILFSDIEMPEISGVDLLKELRDKVTYAVFITSYPEYALEGYEHNVNNYVLKPISPEKIEEAVNKLKHWFETKEKAEKYDLYWLGKDGITIKDGYKHRTINQEEIAYFAALKDYTKLVLLSNESVLLSGNISSVLKDSRFDSFIRIHKSYAVRKEFINTIEATSLTLINKVNLPIGRTYKKDLKNLLL